MIPRKYAPMLFGLMLSGVMSLLISGIATLRVVGLASGFVGAWASAWTMAWGVTFPTVLLVAPLVRRVVDQLTRQEV